MPQNSRWLFQTGSNRKLPTHRSTQLCREIRIFTGDIHILLRIGGVIVELLSDDFPNVVATAPTVIDSVAGRQRERFELGAPEMKKFYRVEFSEN